MVGICYGSQIPGRRVQTIPAEASIGAVKDSTNGHYRIQIEAIILEGFTYNKDRKILLPKDSRPGEWAHTLRKWKTDRGIPEKKK